VWRLFASLVLLFPVLCNAEGTWLALNSKITKIGNTAGNGEVFFVVATGGAGPCVTTARQANIYFSIAAAGTSKVYDRAYASALATLTSGRKVNIYNYVDGTCNSASAAVFRY
jgi:hypothetical protein